MLPLAEPDQDEQPDARPSTPKTNLLLKHLRSTAEEGKPLTRRRLSTLAVGYGVSEDDLEQLIGANSITVTDVVDTQRRSIIHVIDLQVEEEELSA